MHDSLWRTRNAVRRLVAGLPVSNAPPSPEAPSAVYRVLGSIYRFAADHHVDGASALDWGCGSGFGSAVLRDAGARPVLGVDPGEKAIRYARRRFRRPELDFRVAPLDLAGGALEGLPPFERVVAVDVLGRLAEPERVVPELAARMAPGGVMVASLPPVLDGPTLEHHRARHPGAAGLFLWDWSDLLRGCFRELRLFRHLPPEGVLLDLASPRPSPLREEAFRFEEIPLDDLDNVGTLGAVFVGSGPTG